MANVLSSKEQEISAAVRNLISLVREDAVHVTVKAMLTGVLKPGQLDEHLRPSARGTDVATPTVKRRPGRPPGPARKKPPIQLCPVPGCKNRAAPVFGMVCGAHRGVAKAKIKKYRAARRAKA